MSFRHALLVPLLLLCTWVLPAHAAGSDIPALLHMLDYIGVDYPATVAQGNVTNSTEYAEQQEFAQRVRDSIRALPAGPDQVELSRQAKRLTRLIAARTEGSKVNTLTGEMRARIIRAFDVATAPRSQPDLARGAALFASQCSSCHGPEGMGNGPVAAGLDPRPTNFHDRSRADQRSLYGLYSTITLGVPDTAMRGFGELSDADRWALAFYVGGLAYQDPTLVAQGREQLEQHRANIVLASPTALTRITPAEAQALPNQDGLAALAALRHDPSAVFGKASPLATAIDRLDASLTAYRQGDTAQAYQFALSAYLDGFELAEASLRATDPAGVKALEGDMMAFRQAVRTADHPGEVTALHDQLVKRLGVLREHADNATLDGSVAMGSAYIILLREGVEALLVLAAIIGILIKTGRRDALPYVHAGWVGALALGAATWAASMYVVDISGASRELTEGGTALVAVVVLLYVGFWLHDKSHAQQWQAFVKKRIQGALGGRALWALSAVAFLAVYREVFETVLFYQALWLQTEAGGQSMLLAGVGLAVVTLLVVGWIILKSSMRLPLAAFFRVNAAIMFVLALVFAGHGVAGLQAAGVLPATAVPFIRIDLLGIYPTAETLGAQALLLLVLAVVMWRTRGPLSLAGKNAGDGSTAPGQG